MLTVCVCVFYVDLSSIAFHILEGVGVSRDNLRLNPIWEVLLYVSASVHTKAQRFCANDRNQHLENVAS